MHEGESEMKAMDVMVHDVVTVTPDDDVHHAVKLMVDRDVSALPVVDAAGKVVGIVSESDVMRREEIDTDKRRPWWLEAITPAATLAHDFAKSHGQKVREVMSQKVVSATEETTLRDLATLLEKHRIKRVPILREGTLVGIVSRANLVQALATAQWPVNGAADADRDIRLKLLDRLKSQKWTDFGSRNITVHDGVVHIWGLVGSDDERKALLALAEEVPGVKSVCDETFPGY
jgi:CBS-domain-containing membrane protein